MYTLCHIHEDGYVYINSQIFIGLLFFFFFFLNCILMHALIKFYMIHDLIVYSYTCWCLWSKQFRRSLIESCNGGNTEFELV